MKDKLLLLDDLPSDARFVEFAHVLRPLADLDPNLIHPTRRKTMREIWASSGLQGTGGRIQRTSIE